MKGFRLSRSGVNSLKSKWALKETRLVHWSKYVLLSQYLIIKWCIPLDLTLRELSNGMWNSKIRHTGKKLWPFEVGTVGPNGPTRSSLQHSVATFMGRNWPARAATWPGSSGQHFVFVLNIEIGPMLCFLWGQSHTKWKQHFPCYPTTKTCIKWAHLLSNQI